MIPQARAAVVSAFVCALVAGAVGAKKTDIGPLAGLVGVPSELKTIIARLVEQREADKQLAVWRPPRVLVLHAKRFVDDKRGRRHKLSTQLDFPLFGLDLRHCLHPRAPDTCCTVYDLIGVSNHMGRLRGGHYTADCATADGQWHRFNDDTLEVLPGVGVGPAQTSCSSRLDSKSAYLLFYVQRESKPLV